MPTYIGLLNWTDQGVQGFKETVSRYRAAKQAFEAQGVRFRDIYWTMGDTDIVAVLEADDEAALAAATLQLGAQGNIRTRMMRAFSEQEMEGIVGRAG
jgi:uncharacterized protein with GYD domain